MERKEGKQTKKNWEKKKKNWGRGTKKHHLSTLFFFSLPFFQGATTSNPSPTPAAPAPGGMTAPPQMSEVTDRSQQSKGRQAAAKAASAGVAAGAGGRNLEKAPRSNESRPEEGGAGGRGTW